MTEKELNKQGCGCGSKSFIQLDANEFECTSCEKVVKTKQT
ncbi:hypothetical protein [Niallia taxi]|nr:hypothetical protein [Niallia taxi]